MSLSPRRLLRAPAVQAALVQALVFLPTLLIVFVLSHAGLPMGYAGVALIQGAVAAFASFRIGLARWWMPIQFLFPVLLLFARSFELPPWLYLGCFLFMLVLYWSTFRTQVPYYPSGARVWKEVERLLPVDRPLRVIDIGSGLGGLALHLARVRPQAEVIGIELAPLPWLISRLRAALSGSRARFLRGDYEALDFADYDLVFAYLSPAAMPAVWRKARAEMRHDTILTSFEFDIPGAPEGLTIWPEGRPPPLKVWHF